MIHLIGASVGKYMWLNSQNFIGRFWDCSLENEVRVIEHGYISPNSSDYFEETIIECNGYKYVGNTVIHSNAQSYNSWLRSNNTETPISIHIIAITEGTTPPIVSKTLNAITLFVIVPDDLLRKYFTLTNSDSQLCGEYLSKLSSLSRVDMFETLFVERLESKCDILFSYHKLSGGNWLNTLLYSIFDAYNIASKNRKYFRQLIYNIKYYSIIQTLNSVEEVEALLLGSAGLLDKVEFADDYLYSLRKCFANISQKFSLPRINPLYWDSSSVKGISIYVSFAQLASIIFNNKTLLYDVIESRNLDDLRKLFTKDISIYWQSHSDFMVLEENVPKTKNLSKQKVDLLLINGILPFITIYAKANNLANIDSQKIIDYYCQIPKEENTFIRKWEKMSIELNDSFESQAIIQLTKNYCKLRQCYRCKLGQKMLKGSSTRSL